MKQAVKIDQITESQNKNVFMCFVILPYNYLNMIICLRGVNKWAKKPTTDSRKPEMVILNYLIVRKSIAVSELNNLPLN